MKGWKTGVEDPAGEDTLVPVKDAQTLCYDRRNWPCILQTQILPVNGQGIVLNCSNRSDDANLRGSLFETTVSEIFAKRKTDPACKACQSVGYHIYATCAYTPLSLLAGPRRRRHTRKLGLAGRFPKFSAWATRNLYLRPQKKKSI